MLNNINAYWPKIRSTYLCIFKILKIKNFHWQRYNLPCTVGFVRVKPLHFFYIPIVKPPLFSGGFSGLSLPKHSPLVQPLEK